MFFNDLIDSWTGQHNLHNIGSYLKAAAALQDGYDHSYFFISSFVDEHVAHAAQALKSS